jgi:hypothetical protein
MPAGHGQEREFNYRGGKVLSQEQMWHGLPAREDTGKMPILSGTRHPEILQILTCAMARFLFYFPA